MESVMSRSICFSCMKRILTNCESKTPSSTRSMWNSFRSYGTRPSGGRSSCFFFHLEYWQELFVEETSESINTNAMAEHQKV
ncbi:hypothetical protein ScPMuIL_007606 [Solemya velum]